MSDPTMTAARDYTRDSGIADAAQQFFNRYVDFQGRSNRGEFWWWVLANLIIGIVLSIIDTAVFGPNATILAGLWALATVVPNIALGIRRMHDIDRTGWWVLLGLIPVVGFLVLIYFYVQKPTPGPNRFG